MTNVFYQADGPQDLEALRAALRELLNTGLTGADDYRLCLLACKGNALGEKELLAAQRFGDAVRAARAVLAKVSV